MWGVIRKRVRLGPNAFPLQLRRNKLLLLLLMRAEKTEKNFNGLQGLEQVKFICKGTRFLQV